LSAFYTRDGERFVATPATVGPWDPKLQHGSPVASLLATRLSGASELRVAHFTMDFLGPVPVATLDVTTSLDRPGKKIELRSAVASVDGKPRVRASAWLVSTTEGRARDARIDEPVPPIPETATSTYFEAVPRFGYGDALEWRFAEGHFAELGPAAVWTKLRVAIVDGEAPTQLARVLAMIDSANGISAELDVRQFLFVPVNLTVSLMRMPEGEWVGMRAETQIASGGVGTTRARIFDTRGTIGHALQTLYVEAR
jgi:hypothetical protein